MTNQTDFEFMVIWNPADKQTRLVFADWLKDNGDDQYELAMRWISDTLVAAYGQRDGPSLCLSLPGESFRSYCIRYYELGQAMSRIVESLPIITKPPDFAEKDFRPLFNYGIDTFLKIEMVPFILKSVDSGCSPESNPTDTSTKESTDSKTSKDEPS